MALIVQKFGGTSVGTVERIEQVADKVKKFREAGNDLGIVLSAMSGETNRLIDQTHVPAEARLYDGSSWRTISLPEEVAAENVNLFPVSLASDRIFFTTYPDDSQTSLYYVLLNDSQPTLTLCWELPRGSGTEG